MSFLCLHLKLHLKSLLLLKASSCPHFTSHAPSGCPSHSSFSVCVFVYFLMMNKLNWIFLCLHLKWLSHCTCNHTNTNAMRSREISLNSNMWHFQFSIWLKCSFCEVHFAENLTWIGPVVPKLWVVEGFSQQQTTRKQEIHSFIWLHLTINAPKFWLATDSATSQIIHTL